MSESKEPAKQKGQPPARNDAKDERKSREERLAAALRDNLKRRKQQARGRKS